MAQQDSASHIYFGISVIPVAPIFHTIEDTSWYYTRFSPGGSQYQTLARKHFLPTYNIASGAMFFVSFSHFLDMSVGVMRDLIPYNHYTYIDGKKSKEKYYYYRGPVNIKLSIFRSKSINFFAQTGLRIPDSFILEGLSYFGVGALHTIKDRLSLSASCDFCFYRAKEASTWSSNFKENKIFPSAILAFNFSYLF